MSEYQPTIRYFSWEGDACRLHIDENGEEKADIYRSGKGAVEIRVVDLLQNSYEIGEEEYKKLVLEEISLHKELS